MLEIRRTYGKTVHTWPVDVHPDVPLGPPQLMVSYTADDQGPPMEMVRARDERSGMDTARKRELREAYLPPYEKKKEADAWEETKKGIVFEVKETDYKPYSGQPEQEATGAK